MPKFNPDALRQGPSAIASAVEMRNNNNSEFRPFLKDIYWSKDKDFHYLLFLTPIRKTYQVLLHPYLPTENGKETIIAWTDESIGERFDPIEEEWGYRPRLTNLAIAVDLDPLMETVKGRERPVGFEVKTFEFQRRVRDDNGEPTDEKEIVIAPVVGLVAQSPFNFFSQLANYDAEESPIDQTPVKITRIGDGSGLTYSVIGYDAPVELDNLINYIENVNYVTEPDKLLSEIETMTPYEAAGHIGDYLLSKKVEELADMDRYEEIRASITEPSRWSGKRQEPKRRPMRRKQETSISPEDRIQALRSKIASV